MNEFPRQKISGPKSEVLTAKWAEPVLDEGYIPFPKRLIRSAARIFHGEYAIEQLLVVLALVDYLRPNLKRSPSIGYLAFHAGMDSDRFQERLRELKTAGLVTTMGNAEALVYDLKGLYRAILETSDEE